MKLIVKAFDVSSIKPDRIINVIGKRGTGKSHLIKEIMYTLRSRFDIGCGMTPTFSSAQDMKECMPNGMVFEDGYNESQLKKMLALFKALVRRDKERHAFLWLDDCMADRKMMHGVHMRDLHMNGRHFWLTFINAMQYLMDIGPDLRTQVDYVFVLQENSQDQKMKLWKYFFGMFAKFADFDKVMTACTDNFGALVLDNTIKSSNAADKIFWYQSSAEIPKFKMFRPIYWDLSWKYQKETSEIDESDALLKPVKMGGEANDEKDNDKRCQQVPHQMTDANNPRVETVIKQPIQRRPQPLLPPPQPPQYQIQWPQQSELCSSKPKRQSQSYHSQQSPQSYQFYQNPQSYQSQPSYQTPQSEPPPYQSYQSYQHYDMQPQYYQTRPQVSYPSSPQPQFHQTIPQKQYR